MREVNGYSRKALEPEKGQQMSCAGVFQPGAARHTNRQLMFTTVYPNSHTAHRRVGSPWAWGLFSRLAPRDQMFDGQT